jgi:cytochrome oxidase Cu insertion factor (SCO1/SenC/PrrC family)
VSPPAISRRAIWIGVLVFAVLGVGGAFADRSFRVQPAATPTTLPDRAAGSGPPAVVNRAPRPSPQTTAQFVGLKRLDGEPAPPIPLRSQNGRPFSWADVRGRPVALTFLGDSCTGICPVVASELRLASAEARADGRPVAIVVVNADPGAARPSGSGATATRLVEALPGATVLDGSLGRLQKTWRSYGVTIELQPATGALAYTAVIDLVDGRGRLRESLTPFADESFSGADSLPAVEVRRFAGGIAAALAQVQR